MPRLLALAFLAVAPTALAQEAGGLTWTAPAGWTLEAPRPMRAATYRLPAVKGDTQGPELAVFFFGTGQGGSVEANVQRWVGQFQGAKGGAPETKTKKETFAGFPATWVDVKGTYAGSGMGMGPKEPQPGSRLLGAIVEGPQGPVFFKLTGPEKSVGASEKDFRKALGSLKKKG
ncbi:MAG: hypothetical protein L0Y66_13715 [Myxococcaceae bacterium]|nr:hypothetical protein [Myxococcaceae bacterium]MCI0670292.1 hypothetical protein [Myxococcaceae bacterium]